MNIAEFVLANTGERLTAVQTHDVTNPSEWMVLVTTGTAGVVWEPLER